MEDFPYVLRIKTLLKLNITKNYAKYEYKIERKLILSLSSKMRNFLNKCKVFRQKYQLSIELGYYKIFKN